MSSNRSDGSNPPTNNQVPARATRSGRRVREPVRYEPDPNVVLEDDYSDGDEYDSDSDSDSFIEEGMVTEDEEFVSDIGESEHESDSDEDEDSVLGEDESEDESEEEDVQSESDMEDIIDFDCLTDNATDGSLSSDEED